MSSINYAEKIPNNVDLQNDRTLQRALEHWQPHFLQWWREMGPTDFESADVYLRTAISVDAQGWAHYGTLKMPDYRWGIFLADAAPERKIGFGDQMGRPVWQQVAGAYRCTVRRLIVPRGCTVAAAVRRRRQVPVEELCRKRVRPLVAHLPLHADGGSAPHVRRRDGHQPRGEAHARSDEGAGHRRPGAHPRRRRHRPADAAEVSELLVL